MVEAPKTKIQIGFKKIVTLCMLVSMSTKMEKVAKEIHCKGGPQIARNSEIKSNLVPQLNTD